MSLQLIIGGEYGQTDAATELTWFVVARLVRIQLFPRKERTHADVANEAQLNAMGALDVVLQLRQQRERLTAVLTDVPPSFVYLFTVPSQTGRELELLIASSARIVVHVFVTLLVQVSDIFPVKCQKSPCPYKATLNR